MTQSSFLQNDFISESWTAATGEAKSSIFSPLFKASCENKPWGFSCVGPAHFQSHAYGFTFSD